MGRVLDWTLATAHCYKRNCCCEGCKYMIWTHGECKAKEAVIKLLDAHGEPPEILLEYQD